MTAALRDWLTASPHTLTLSVYVRFTDDATDSGAQSSRSWISALRTALDVAKQRCASDEARRQFDQCADMAWQALRHDVAQESLPGWYGCFAPSGASLRTGLLRPPATGAHWGDGPAVLPLMQSRIHAPAWLLLVAPRGARILRLHGARFTEMERYELECPSGDLPVLPSPPIPWRRETGASAASGASASREQLARGVLLTNATRRVIGLMNGGGLLLVGGDHTLTPAIMAQLPDGKLARTYHDARLTADAAPETLRDVAVPLLEALVAQQQRAWLDAPARGRGVGVYGLDAVQAALASDRVEHVVFTPAFATAHPDDAEAICRAALQHGVTVEPLEVPAAAWCDPRAEGVLATLRTGRPAGVPRRSPIPTFAAH